MKKFYTIPMLILASLSCLAQEPLDTLQVQELEEIVVEGKNQTANASGLSFLPTKTQKRASQSGYDLLGRIGIPTLKVNPLEKSVSTVSGQGVALFINQLPASQQDVSALKPTDVIRVEYLEYPSDPRYGGAEYVVNYVVQEYQWGGYTNLNADGAFLTGRNAGASLFSKFAYKRMTYDLYAGWNYANDHHSGSYTSEIFHLTDAAGIPYEMHRETNTTWSREKSNSLPVTFRATYNGNRFRAVNTLGYSFYHAPGSVSEGTLKLRPSLGTDYSYARSASSIARNLSWNGNFYFLFNHGWDASLTGTAGYTRSAGNSLYATDVPADAPIVNNNRETAWNMRFNIDVRKKFNDASSGGLKYNIGNTDNDVDYSGTSPYSNRFKHLFMFGALSYDRNWEKINLQTFAGYAIERTSINGQAMTQSYPVIHVYATYVPSQQHRLNLLLHTAAGTPSQSMKSPNVIRQNEFMYMTGTPDLKTYRHITVRAGYTWLLSNRFFANFFVDYFRTFNSITTVWAPYARGEALLQSYLNSGWYHDFKGGVYLTYKPVNNLEINGGVQYANVFSRGATRADVSAVQYSLSCNYYIGLFYVGGFIAGGGESMDVLSHTVFCSRTPYNISAGWGNGVWNVNLAVCNFLRSNWHANINKIDSPLYQKWTLPYSSDSYHRQVKLSVSYTFSYGKKLQRGNEVGAQQGVSSAVLK